MALTGAMTGQSGRITIPTAELTTGASTAVDIQLGDWTATFERDIHPADTFTAAGTDNHKVEIGGMSDLKGSATGFLDSGGALNFQKMIVANHEGSAGFVLVPRNLTTDMTYTFNGIITSVDMGVTKGAMTSLVVNFESSGPITPVDGIV